ncbi:hypothetical protein BaRGS_00038453, partial [Batillaria attramentaria]
GAKKSDLPFPCRLYYSGQQVRRDTKNTGGMACLRLSVPRLSGITAFCKKVQTDTTGSCHSKTPMRRNLNEITCFWYRSYFTAFFCVSADGRRDMVKGLLKGTACNDS